MTMTLTPTTQTHRPTIAIPTRQALLDQLREERAAYAQARTRAEAAWQAYYRLVDAQYDRGQWDFQALEQAAQAAEQAEKEKSRLYHRMNAIGAQLLALTPNP